MTDTPAGGTHPGHTPNTADSAGVPWAGRELKPNPFSGDTGEADPTLQAALTRVTENPYDPQAHVGVLAALRGVRVYAPVLPTAVEHTSDEHGLVHDNKSEMAMVRLASGDGRECTPMFTDIPTLTAWHHSARPVPIETERLGAAAVEEGAQLVIINPGSPAPFLLRRPALWAWLQGQDWLPGWANPQVAAAVSQEAARFDWLSGVSVAPGSAKIASAGPEVALRLRVDRQPAAEEFDQFQQALSARPEIADAVDSLTIALTR